MSATRSMAASCIPAQGADRVYTRRTPGAMRVPISRVPCADVSSYAIETDDDEERGHHASMTSIVSANDVWAIDFVRMSASVRTFASGGCDSPTRPLLSSSRRKPGEWVRSDGIRHRPRNERLARHRSQIQRDIAERDDLKERFCDRLFWPLSARNNRPVCKLSPTSMFFDQLRRDCWDIAAEPDDRVIARGSTTAQ